MSAHFFSSFGSAIIFPIHFLHGHSKTTFAKKKKKALNQIKQLYDESHHNTILMFKNKKVIGNPRIGKRYYI